MGECYYFKSTLSQESVLMDISEVARRSKLPASTLRYYEEKGLIRSAGRKGIRRVYSSGVLERLVFIALARSAGLSLDEIKNMLTTEGIQVDRELLLSKAEALDHRIKELQAMRDGLRHAASCKAPNHFECPKFLRLLKVANHRWSRTRRGKGLNPDTG